MPKLKIFKDKCLFCGATEEDWILWTGPWIDNGVKTTTYKCKCGRFFRTEVDVGGTLDFYSETKA